MMFYDLTSKKVAPLSSLVVVLLIAVALFSYSNNSLQLVERTMQLSERIRSSFLFSLFYNPPWANTASVTLGEEGAARAVPVLIYHGTPPEGNDMPPLPQNVFVEQMRALKADGWETITMQQFTDFMKNGKPLPKKSFLLTFDDGRRESFYPVDPVLESLNYHAIMFVITGFSLPQGDEKASTYYLNKTELQHMLDTGRWELESHGDQDHRLYDIPDTSSGGEVETIKKEHFLSNKFWLPEPGRVETNNEYVERVRNDLAHSRALLQSEFRINVRTFAFPFNDYGQNSKNFQGSRDLLEDEIRSIYTFAMYQVDPEREDPFNYPDKNTLMIKRIEPTASLSGQDLVNILNGAEAKNLPYHATTFTNEWNSNWGNVTASDEALMLKATPKTTGAASLLNGSSWWQDYLVEATVDWKSGEAFSLISRYQSDSRPFLACAFSDGQIVIQTHVGKKTTSVKSVKYSLANQHNMALLMRVSGNQVTCAADSLSVEAEVGAEFVHQGSVGVQIWGHEMGTEAADVKSISIREA